MIDFLSRTQLTEVTTTDQSFSIPFDYITETHMEFYVGVSDTDLMPVLYTGTTSFIDKQNVQLPDAAVGTYIQARRNTPKDEKLLQFVQSNPVLPSDVDFLNRATFFNLQEMCDKIAILEAGEAINVETVTLTEYEIQLGGTLDAGAQAGPLVMGREAVIPIGGGSVRVSVGTNPTEAQTVELLKNGSAVGSIVIGTDGSPVFNFPVEIPLVLGDDLVLKPTADSGLRNLGVVFVLTLSL